MKTKLGNLLNATLHFAQMNQPPDAPPIESPFNRLMNAHLPGENVKLVKIAQRVGVLLKEFEGNRQALIKRHGEEKDGAFTVPPEAFAAFNSDLMELVNEDVEIPVAKLREESVATSTLSGADVAALAFLIEGLGDEATPQPASVTKISEKRRKKTDAASPVAA